MPFVCVGECNQLDFLKRACYKNIKTSDRRKEIQNVKWEIVGKLAQYKWLPPTPVITEQTASHALGQRKACSV